MGLISRVSSRTYRKYRNQINMTSSGDKSSLNVSDPILKRAIFAEMLQELTFNSKEIINKITLHAGKNKDIADVVHELLTAKLREVRITTDKSQFLKISKDLFEFGLYSNKNKLLNSTFLFDVFLIFFHFFHLIFS